MSNDLGSSSEVALGLLSLSPEVILEISSCIIGSWQELQHRFRDPRYLDRSGALNARPGDYGEARQTLNNLRLVCRYLSDVLQRDVFKAIVFDFHITRHRNTLSEVDSRVSTLSDTTHPACTYANFLRIHCLNSVGGGYRPDIRVVPDTYTLPVEPEIQVQVTNLRGRIGLQLSNTILSFRHLRCVAWNVEDNSDHSILIVGALSSLHSLEDVTLFVTKRCKSPEMLQVNRFSNLRTLSIEASLIRIGPLYSTGEFANHLAQIISQSPLLSQLSIVQTSLGVIVDSPICFQKLTKEIPLQRPLAHLRQMRLQCQVLQSMNQASAHMLKSLKTLHVEEFTHRRPYWDSGDPNSFWKKLHSAGVELHSLTVNHLSKPLLDYLASFSCLKRLHIELAYRVIPEYSKYDGQVFRQTVLPLHSLCLRPTSTSRSSEHPMLRDPDQEVSGLIFERSITKTPDIFLHRYFINVCIDTVPRSLDFVMDQIVNVGYKRLDIIDVGFSSTRRMFLPKSNDPRSIDQEIFQRGMDWISSLLIIEHTLYPKNVYLSNVPYHLVPNEDYPRLYNYSPM